MGNANHKEQGRGNSPQGGIKMKYKSKALRHLNPKQIECTVDFDSVIGDWVVNVRHPLKGCVSVYSGFTKRSAIVWARDQQGYKILNQVKN